ncbi:MAG: hypothetical protein U5K43_01320 [Halofilum sp. (in: g-proteobacteria)]|nr:hypothetical protein [Halofilum sp. (in: g-proteobacteria)]
MLRDGSGWGALAGITGVDLARRGFAASPAQLPASGPTWATLGHEWLLAEQYVKPHPVCFWAQPAVTAALRLRAADGLDPGAIAAVRIDTFHEATRLYQGLPASTQVAQYALAFPVAAALVHGRLGPEEITGAGLTDATVRELAGRVAVRERAAYSRRFPGQRLAAVTVRLADGTELASGTTEPRGTPRDPMDREAIVAKYRDQAAPVLGAERSAALEACALGLGRPGADLGSLLRLTARP